MNYIYGTACIFAENKAQGSKADCQKGSPAEGAPKEGSPPSIAWQLARSCQCICRGRAVVRVSAYLDFQPKARST